jgi:hypothetical protein
VVRQDAKAHQGDAEKDLSINMIRSCDIDFDATVFGSAQNEPNFGPISPMSLSALRFWPRRSPDEAQSANRSKRHRVQAKKIQSICNGKSTPSAM